MTQSIETIERRINALGLTEPTIQQRGRQQRQRNSGAAAGRRRSFARESGHSGRRPARIETGGRSARRIRRKWRRSRRTAAFCLRARNWCRGVSESRNPTADQGEVWYVLSRAPVVTGRDLRSATENRSTQNPGQWQINFSLSAEAARRFGPFTEQNVNRQMAIVLQHRVYSAPVIHGRIDDTGVIEGNFSQDSAHDLALVLRAGALPASIKYLEERTVGPSLGADSIRHGVQASILSLMVVMLFMLVYYRLSGRQRGFGVDPQPASFCWRRWRLLARC